MDHEAADGARARAARDALNGERERLGGSDRHPACSWLTASGLSPSCWSTRRLTNPLAGTGDRVSGRRIRRHGLLASVRKEDFIVVNSLVRSTSGVATSGNQAIAPLAVAHVGHGGAS